jgi:AdoMet-dependent rRNA methyltransferase SPB1
MIVNNKKAKREIYDSAYNRYAFNDDNLPSWFVDDENRHNKPQVPVSKELVQEMKLKFMEINARPIKKVQEAKVKKKIFFFFGFFLKLFSYV